MFKRLAAGIPALALAAAVGVAVLPAASAAGGEPSAPVITLTPASCEVQENLLDVSNLSTTGTSQYRFVLMMNGKATKQLNKGERESVLSKTAKSAETLFGKGVKLGYGSSVSIKAYWFNNGKNGAFKFTDRPEETLKLEYGSLTKAIALSESNTITLTDPATLNCEPAASENGEGTAENQGSAEQGQNGSSNGESTGTNNQGQTGDTTPDSTQTEDPKKGADQLPAAPAFELSAAKCEANKVVDNTLSVNAAQKQENYRFVVTQDGKSVSLSDADDKMLRTKLWTDGKLSASDIKKAYPSFSFDYSKPVSVQAYWFDKDSTFNAELYDTALKLAAGKSDRFIKLGEAKTLTLVDTTSLNCEPKKPEVLIDGVTPAADTVPEFVAGTSVKTSVKVSGFTPLAQVDVYLHSDPVHVGTFAANKDGVVEFGLTVPEKVAAGAHTLVMTEKASSKPAFELPVTVSKPLTTKPAAPAFTLTAATCDGTKKVDNVLTVNKEQKNDLLRFVATYNGLKASLKTELRNKLWTEGALTTADVQAAYPKFTFDYTKDLTVQAYWFDQKGVYAKSLYDTTVGKDRFIALGEPVTVKLVDMTSLDCDPTKPEVTVGTASGPDVPPTLVADDKTATPVTAQGFTPEGDVKVEIHSDTVVIGTFKADKFGALKFDLLLPTTVPAGAHKLILIDLTSKKSASADIVVKAAEKAQTPDPQKNEGDDKTKQPQTKTPEMKDSSKPAQTVSPEKKDAKAESKLAKTGFESGLLSLAGFLALGLGTAAMATARARTRK